MAGLRDWLRIMSDQRVMVSLEEEVRWEEKTRQISD